MNYFDCILVFPVLYGLYKGFSKGLILELASLLGLLLGVYGSVRFSSFIFEYLINVLEIDAYYLQLASYALTFIVIVLLVTLIGKVLTMLVKMVALGFVNRLFGAFFGGLKALLVLCVLLLFFDKLNNRFSIISSEMTESSIMYKPLLSCSMDLYPSVIEEYENQKKQLE